MNKVLLFAFLLFLTSCNIFNSKGSGCDNLVLTDKTGKITGTKGKVANQWVISSSDISPRYGDITIKPAYPNPSSQLEFNDEGAIGQARLKFTIPNGGFVDIEAVSETGGKKRQLDKGVYPGGTYSIIFSNITPNQKKECIRVNYTFVGGKAHGYVLFQ